MQINGAASNTDIQSYQRIESYDAAALAGQTVTVQFTFYNASGSSITPKVTTKYAGSTDTWTSPTTDLAATNMQACANGSTCTEAYTFTASSNATNGYEVFFDFGAMTSSADIIEMSGFDIRATPGFSTGLNSAPPTPEVPDAGTEFVRNERYFQVISNAAASVNTATTVSIVASLGVIMRTTPTAAASGPLAYASGASGYVAQSSANTGTAYYGPTFPTNTILFYKAGNFSGLTAGQAGVCPSYGSNSNYLTL